MPFFYFFKIIFIFFEGELVTQLEHALQAAFQAEQEGANYELITAALIHDLGIETSLPLS